ISRVGLWTLVLAWGVCTDQQTLGNWEGPEQAAVASSREWSFNEEKAKVLESPHYRIYTTIKEGDVLELLPQVMEGAMMMYREIAPDVAIADRPLECYI